MSAAKVLRLALPNAALYCCILSLSTQLHAQVANCEPSNFLVTSSPGTLELCVGQGRLVQLTIAETEITEVEVANEDICRRIFRPTRQNFFEVVGTAEGDTSLTIWAEKKDGSVTPIRIPVTVNPNPAPYDRLAASINTALNAGLPAPEVNIEITPVPTSGSILVSGKVKHWKQLGPLRSLIEGTALNDKAVTYDVDVDVDEFADLSQQINSSLNAGLPAPEVSVSLKRLPLSNKLYVEGKVKFWHQLAKVETLVESAEIEGDEIAYNVAVEISEYSGLAAFINRVLNEGLPQPEVAIAIEPMPLSGKILVSGEVKCCRQLAQVKSFIEGNSISGSDVVYKVTSKCSCGCPSNNCVPRRCFLRFR